MSTSSEKSNMPKPLLAGWAIRVDDAGDVWAVSPGGNGGAIPTGGNLWQRVLRELVTDLCADTHVVKEPKDVNLNLLEALRDMVSDRECLSDATVQFARQAIRDAEFALTCGLKGEGQ